MICLRCGHCCKTLAVIIVDDPRKGIADGNLTFHEGAGTPCKHLIGEAPGEYSCALHDEDWYWETPCWQHTQIEYTNSECRMGKFQLGRG